MNRLAESKQSETTDCGERTDESAGHPTLAQRLSRVRHDLRNPLSGILGFSEILIEESNDTGDARWLREFGWINQAASEMLKAINEHVTLEGLAKDAARIKELRARINSLAPKIVEAAERVAKQVTDADPGTLREDLSRIAASARQIPELAAFLLSDSLLSAVRRNSRSTPREMELTDPTPQDRGGEVSVSMDETPGCPASTEPATEAEGFISGAVLIVDDTEANRTLLSRTLMRQGYRVTTAAEGRQALDLLQTQAFDLVLLDIVMPGIDGYQVLTRMKQDRVLRHVPVIMISALDDLSSLVRCIEGGADDYLTKPFDPVLLRARIGACLEKKRFRDTEQALLKKLQEEQAKSEALLLNILPRAIADRLMHGENKIVDSFADVSVLFADLVGFSSLFNAMSPSRVVDLLNQIFSAFDILAQERGLEKIKTIGDAYMVVGGLPLPLEHHAEAIAELALNMQRRIHEFNAEYGTPIQIRIGIDTGPCVAGIIGRNKFIYDLWGESVNTASRMESQGEPDRIQVTQTTRDRLQDKYVFETRGILDIKGKGAMPVYWLHGNKQ